MSFIGYEYEVKLSVVFLYHFGMDQSVLTCFYRMIYIEDWCEKWGNRLKQWGWNFQKNRTNFGRKLVL